jgi:hypothetical protein
VLGKSPTLRRDGEGWATRLGKNNALISPAFATILDSTDHRDELARTDANWK